MLADGVERISGASSSDPSLYAGSASYYATGRMAYPAGVVEGLVAALALDGSGSLLDVGCGPGSLTLLLAPHVAQAIGVDADADMLTEAARLARHAHVSNVSWRHLRAEELPAGIPPVRVVTFAQSFHWMDQARVARAVRGMLTSDGALVHVHAATHQGIDTTDALAHPQPPWEAIAALVQRYLGGVRRATVVTARRGTPGGEDAVYRGAGFTGRQRLEVPVGEITRTDEEIIASIYSLSSSTPYLFGDDLPAVDADLRALLATSNPAGVYSEVMPSITLDIWR